MRYFLIDSTNGLPARARGFDDYASAASAAQDSADYLRRRIVILKWDGAFLDLDLYVEPNDVR